MPSPLPGSNAKMREIQSKLNALAQGIQGNANKLAQNAMYGGPPVVGPGQSSDPSNLANVKNLIMNSTHAFIKI